MLRIIFISLSAVALSYGETKPQDEQSIGGIIYSTNYLSDSEKRQKAEILAKKLEQLQQFEKQPLDYSNSTSEDIYINLIISDGGGNAWIAGIKELSKRPDDLRMLIDQTIAKEKPFIYEFAKLPIIARSVGLEYQIEVTKKILFHPAIRQFDQIFIYYEPLLSYLEQSSSDQTAVLDRLVEEGRIKSGSATELKWRRALAGDSNSRHGSPKNAKAHPNLRKKQVKKSEEDLVKKRVAARKQNRLPWIIAGFLLVGILAFLFKMPKGKTSQ